MNKYILCNTVEGGSHNAGSKAGSDALRIAMSQGYRFCKLFAAKGNHTTVWNIVTGFLNAASLCFRLHKGDLVLLQYPVNRYLLGHLYPMLKRAGANIVTLIHDVDFLRNVPLKDKGVEGMRQLELSLLSQSDCLICHNSSMIDTLKQNGLNNKMISLELFDYLYDGASTERIGDGAVIVAGNLAEKKAGYLYRLRGQAFPLSLYGSNLSGDFSNTNSTYYGSFPPDELIANLKGDYGLVWDGPETGTCAGDYGQYLRYNNPHKVSLYLAAGIPVILWKQSALYSFVEKYGVGFGVDALEQIDEIMGRQDYTALIQNVQAMQESVRTGKFLAEALKKAEECLQGKDSR